MTFDGENLVLDGSASSETEGLSLHFSWDLNGDLSWDVVGQTPTIANGNDALGLGVGTYQITLRVENDYRILTNAMAMRDSHTYLPQRRQPHRRLIGATPGALHLTASSLPSLPRAKPTPSK
jgi:hypothetical protein